MSKKNPLYILWPLAALILPAYLLIMLTTPLPSLVWEHYPLYGMPLLWLRSLTVLFGKMPIYTIAAYGLLLTTLLWWLRKPKFLSGLTLLLAGFFTGPAGEVMLWILFSGKIGHS